MAECTMICLDNSEWMRNGDYSRTRFEAQHEGAHSVLGHKSNNAESTVGVISLAGGANVGVQVLCSPTDEKIKVMRAFAAAKIGGKADLLTGLRVARLALKYKPSHFKSRIVVFVGSPIEEESRAKLVKVGKDLRKVNIAVDVISMGEHDHNKEILEQFIAAVNKGDTSTLIVVPPGTFPEDAINAAFRTEDSNQWAEYGGINPEQDPELAEVMRQSILEAQAQEQATSGGGGAGAGSGSGGAAGGGEKVQATTQEMEEEEDELLKQAMEMSMAAIEETTGGGEDEKKSTSEKPKENEEKAEEEDAKSKEKSMLDPNFMKSLVKDIPGVDVESEEIQNLLQGEDEKKKKEKGKKGDKKKPKDKE